MRRTFTKLVIPASLAVGSLGLSLGATMPATAATAAAVAAPTTYNGTIVKVQSSRYVFWFNVGPKIYKVKYSSKAFVVGSASMLVKGLPVSVTGSFVGNSTTILKASGVTVEDPNPST